jgi:hypothetical protein
MFNLQPFMSLCAGSSNGCSNFHLEVTSRMGASENISANYESIHSKFSHYPSFKGPSIPPDELGAISSLMEAAPSMYSSFNFDIKSALCF